MTREQWKERLPLIQAFAEGKNVLWESAEGEWHNCDNHSFEEPVKSYRIAPEPKWRKWALEEVPIGAQVRNKSDDQSARLLIVGTLQPDRVFLGSQVEITTQFLFELKEHSTDGGKTWHPCGVLEGQ